LIRTALFAIALLAAAPEAQAQDADALIEEGRALREQGRLEEARARFVSALEAGAGARAHVQIAATDDRMGRAADAYERLRDALATDDPYVAEHRGSLEQQLARIRLTIALLELRGGADGARVVVNGRERGTLPLAQPLAIDPGSVEIEISLGGEPYRIARTLTAGQSAVENVPSESLSRGGASAPIEPWILGGGGVAVVVAGAVLLAVGQGDLGGVTSVPAGTAWEDVADDYDRGVVLSGVGAAALVVGSALVVGAVVWLVTGGSSEASARFDPWTGTARF
jgi:tetratricopeptide (TPR) repeat protein